MLCCFLIYKGYTDHYAQISVKHIEKNYSRFTDKLNLEDGFNIADNMDNVHDVLKTSAHSHQLINNKKPEKEIDNINRPMENIHTVPPVIQKFQDNLDNFGKDVVDFAKENSEFQLGQDVKYPQKVPSQEFDEKETALQKERESGSISHNIPQNLSDIFIDHQHLNASLHINMPHVEKNISMSVLNHADGKYFNISNVHNFINKYPPAADAFFRNKTLSPLRDIAGVKYQIISISLYGRSQRYTFGAIRNAELAKEHFPGWKLRIYTEMPSDQPKYGLVPQGIINKLRELGADIEYIDNGEKVPPMMWRFLVGDDTTVDRFIVRDADSRLSARDAAAVKAWVESGKGFNCIRDHPSHSGYAISGGMWGAVVSEMKRIIPYSWKDMISHTRNKGEYLEDMNFLNTVIWPKVQNHVYCSDSVSCDIWRGAHPFPVKRYGYDHVGQVYDEHDLSRPIDVSILKHAIENKNCISPTAGEGI